MAASFSKIYLVEFNRCVGDDIKKVVRKLRRIGYRASLIRHKTTLIIERPDDKTFALFKRELASMAQPQIGSIIMASPEGRFWLMDNKGNMAGTWQKVDEEML